MQYRPFGSSPLSVSEVGLGAARIGGLFQSSKAEQLRLVRQAFEAGLTLYDTADMYAQGGSERLLGEALRPVRDQVVIASKVGYRFPTRAGLLPRLKPLLKPMVRRLSLSRQQLPQRMLTTVSAQDFSPEYLTRMLEGTLRRLGSDHVDIYQLHSPPAEVIARGDFVEPLERLKQQGKLRLWGIACERADDVLLALRCPGIGAIQVNLSLLHQEALQTAVPAAAAQGVGVIARQVFASGQLTRADLNDVEPAHRTQVESYRRAAQAEQVSLPGLALGFALAQPGVSVALLGMHQPRHLQAALGYLAEAHATHQYGAAQQP